MKNEINPVVGILLVVLILAVLAFFGWKAMNRDVVSIPQGATPAKTSKANK